MDDHDMFDFVDEDDVIILNIGGQVFFILSFIIFPVVIRSLKQVVRC